MKSLKVFSTKLFIFFTILTLVNSSYAFIGASWESERPPIAAFDPGPSYMVDGVVNKNYKELIDLHADIPNFPGVSEQIMRHNFSKSFGVLNKSRPVQKFRPAYGPIPWRMILKPNNVKILFIGQDGTHVAEAAGRPATAGFGGRAQDLAAFFGVEYSAGFINTYAFTIKGQYGARSAPYVYDNQVSTRGTIIPNDVWLMSQDQDSPISQWRSNLIEWIIKNNRESLKLIVLFGGSAKDSIASFIESRGGKVGSRNEKNMNIIQVPEFSLVGSGGNGEFPVPFNKKGKDAYASLLGKSRMDYKNTKLQSEATKFIEENDEKAIKEMVFTKAGPYKNGLIHHAQMGGYDLDQIYVDKNDTDESKTTRSLKGLKLKDGTSVENDILVVALPHPTYLSHSMNDGAIEYWENALKDNETYKKMKEKAGNVPSYKRLDFFKKVLAALPKEQSEKLSNEGFAYGKEKVGNLVEKDVTKLRPYAEKGWKIPADASDTEKTNVNTFDQGEKYAYGRSDIHSVYYDFGTPKNRMVSKSTARRGSHTQVGVTGKKSRGSQIIIFGSRDVPPYDKKEMNNMLSQKANQSLDNDQLFISRARTAKTRYEYDKGPSIDYARLMKKLNFEELYKSKEGKSFSKNGISAYNIKSHPSVGDFGHYRGTFEKPEVVILADPDGYDDLITARALTGTRGQYLQGMMDDLGVKDKYLVVKTVPYGMDGATKEEWAKVIESTKDYRTNLINKILEDSTPKLILADGPNAAAELKRILKDSGKKKFIELRRKGTANNYGIKTSMKYIAKRVKDYKYKKLKGKMNNIPKSHLTYYARVWEGTSGDRVLNSNGDKQKGLAFLEVVPNWVMKQKFNLSAKTQNLVDGLKEKLKGNGFPLPTESIPAYLKRVERDPASVKKQ